MAKRNSHRFRSRNRRFQVQTLEPRMMLAADSIGVTDYNTAAFLDGSIAVTPVFFESDGTINAQTQNWTADEIQETLDKISEGVQWWSRALDRLGTNHSLEFVIDETYARSPVETGYEPIDNESAAYQDYVGQFMTDLGYGDSASLERAVQLFNHQQRLKHGTDWSFTIFVADSSDDDDGLFLNGGQFAAAFAFPGGLYMVTPSTRPASTIAHEMGHIFWARDEYPGGGSYTDRRGYYNAQLINAADNPNDGFVHQDSIMRGGAPLTRAYQAETSPEETLAFVGWRDSDGDGIFDFADVPLDLDVQGYFDTQTSTYHITGSASAVPLRNLNSSGTQSDITLNQIDALQYRLDSGGWIDAQTFGQQNVDFDLSVPIGEAFSTISWRVIDTRIGITSEVIVGTRTAPALASASVNGYAFLDGNENGVRDPGESLLADTTATIRHADGSPLFAGRHNAANFQDGEIETSPDGVNFSTDGSLLRRTPGVFSLSENDDTKVFQYYDQNRNTWNAAWGAEAALEVQFDQPVGQIDVLAMGLVDGGYARVEAFDENGVFIKRTTSQLIPSGQSASVSVEDNFARISSIRISGHAQSTIAITEVGFGLTDTVETNQTGAWQFSNLPAGDYQVQLESDRLIHQFVDSTFTLTVDAGSSQLVAAAAERVASSRHNADEPTDVNQLDGTTARDALTIINDISQFGVRLLSPNEAVGELVDVNNDGFVTSLDALLVINFLGRTGLSGEQVGTEQSIADQADAVFASTGGTLSQQSVAASAAGIGHNGNTENTEPLPLAIPIETLRRTGSQEFFSSLQSPNAADASQKHLKNGELVDPVGVSITADLSEPLS